MSHHPASLPAVALALFLSLFSPFPVTGQVPVEIKSIAPVNDTAEGQSVPPGPVAPPSIIRK
jgi:hypothetical protein